MSKKREQNTAFSHIHLHIYDVSTAENKELIEKRSNIRKKDALQVYFHHTLRKGVLAYTFARNWGCTLEFCTF